jgi:hypothetical protein
MKNLKKEKKDTNKKFAKQFAKTYGTSKKKDSFAPGNLITFKYNALHKENKYDKHPLVVSLGYSKKFGKKYFLGLNLHWFPKSRRVMIASLIVEMLKDRNGKLTYEDVKPLMQMFKDTPMLRMYIVKRVSKKILQMPPETYKRAAAISYEEWAGGREGKE